MDFSITKILTTVCLFLVTAVAEILGCYFPYLILNQGKSHWLWLPTVLALAVFVWLLTLHPGIRANLRRLWWNLHFYRADVAEICRSSQFKSLGSAGWSGGDVRHADYYFAATRTGALIFLLSLWAENGNLLRQDLLPQLVINRVGLEFTFRIF